MNAEGDDKKKTILRNIVTREIAPVPTNHLKVKWNPISYQMYYVMMLVN
ncbi:MAG TPA: hypothetical protein VEL11_17085 [Candidatus Bathyarchaeia archaeon]|nr:hypothetical protein [Candidatus Bathyarchaeia archaeon]